MPLQKISQIADRKAGGRGSLFLVKSETVKPCCFRWLGGEGWRDGNRLDGAEYARCHIGTTKKLIFFKNLKNF